MKEYIRLYVDKLSPFVFNWRPLYFVLDLFDSLMRLVWAGRGVTMYPPLSTNDGHMLFRASFYFRNHPVHFLGIRPAEERPVYFGNDYALSPAVQGGASCLRLLGALLTLAPVIVWDARGLLAKLILLFPNAVNCCVHTNDKEGWNYFRVLARLGVRAPHHYDFRLERPRRKALVLGTGPSIDLLEDMPCSDYDVIICNTIVKNLELCRKIRPRFVVFADAVYHFGPSVYAAAFREALWKFLDEIPECSVLIPELFRGHFIGHAPRFADRIYSIPFAKDRSLSLDYAGKYCVHRIDNVLNQMLAPLAATVSDDISFIGFDGRKASDKGFWAHSAKNNFVDLLDYQKEAHPSFFYKKNLGIYAVRQANNTEWIFSLLEAGGKKVCSLNASSNEAMQKRYQA